eukprot:gene18972-25548_t
MESNATYLKIFINRFASSVGPTADLYRSIFNLRLYDADGSETKDLTTFTLTFNPSFTPFLVNVTYPANLTSESAADIQVAWNVSQQQITPPAIGNLSVVAVELWSGPTDGFLTNKTSVMFQCANATVTAFKQTSSEYAEALVCSLPNYLPSSNYSVWINHPQLGSAYRANVQVQVPISLANITLFNGTTNSAVGSTSGGTLVVVTASSAESYSAAGIQQHSFVRHTPTVGAVPQSNAAIKFTYDRTITPVATAIEPKRGSSEGGTFVTITGSRFGAAMAASLDGITPPTITLGLLECGDVRVVDNSTLTCTTRAPGALKPQGPQPVSILFNGFGFADSKTAGLTYHYVDLCNGKAVIGLEATQLWHKSDEVRRSTLTHKPDVAKLPNYGTKSIAVRQAKEPVFTQLDRCANTGDTTITVAGPVNWIPGDCIVLSSSSFFAQEVDERTIVTATYNNASNTSSITLDMALDYTHLGDEFTIPGDSRGHVVDMRAEVAVLTRNVVLQGDPSSIPFQFGGIVLVNTPGYLGTKALMLLQNTEFLFMDQAFKLGRYAMHWHMHSDMAYKSFVRFMGQAFKFGRYAMHWHMHGDVAYKSFVKGCAVHHTYNRGLTIHGTHRALVQNNVFYDNMGHAVFMEDGIETMNVVDSNLALLTPVRAETMNVGDGNLVSHTYGIETMNVVDGNLVLLTHV